VLGNELWIEPYPADEDYQTQFSSLRIYPSHYYHCNRVFRNLTKGKRKKKENAALKHSPHSNANASTLALHNVTPNTIHSPLHVFLNSIPVLSASSILIDFFYPKNSAKPLWVCNDGGHLLCMLGVNQIDLCEFPKRREVRDQRSELEPFDVAVV